MGVNLGSLNDMDTMKLESIAYRMKLKPRELSRLIIKKFLMEAYEEKSADDIIERRKKGDRSDEIPVQSFVEYYNKVWLPKECPKQVGKNKGESKSPLP